MSKDAKREPKERQETPAAGEGQAPIDAAAEQYKRLEAAELNAVLGRKRCDNCGTIGCWEIYNRERGPDGAGGRVRYVKCKGCGCCGQSPVVVKPEGK